MGFYEIGNGCDSCDTISSVVPNNVNMQMDSSSSFVANMAMPYGAQQNATQQQYNNSIFISTLFDFIDIHNNRITKDLSLKDDMFSIHFFELISKVTINIKKDHFSYFKEKIYPDLKDIFLTKLFSSHI